MRPALLASLILSLMLAPVVAQEAAVAPSPEAEQAMRCGVAFGVMRERMTAAADEDAAGTYDTKAATAFAKAAGELIPAGMSVEQFTALAESYVAEVTAPFRETSLSEADCERIIAGAQ